MSVCVWFAFVFVCGGMTAVLFSGDRSNKKNKNKKWQMTGNIYVVFVFM